MLLEAGVCRAIQSEQDCLPFITLDGFMRGVLPPFQVESEDTRAMARHCSVGIELWMSVEGFILLDTQVCKKILSVSPVGEFHVKEVTLEPLHLDSSSL